MNKDKKFMKMALKEAKIAYTKGEVPVGCVITCNDKVIAKSHNLRETKKSVLAHAEILAISKASKKRKSWILDDCTIYVTLEPCAMCSGAILQARMKRLVIGALEPKHGCCGSVINILEGNRFNHQVIVEKGLLGSDSSELLKSFFVELRQKKPKN